MISKKNAFIILFILTAFLFFGCTETNLETQNTPQVDIQDSTTSTTNQSTSIVSASPEYLTDFSAELDSSGENISIVFSFLDSEQKYTTMTGTGKITILDTSDDEIYSGTITVTPSDFKEAVLQLTKEKILIVEKKIPLSTLTKSKAGDVGTVKMVFGDNSVEFEEVSSTIYGIPAYTDAELLELAEQEYQSSAIKIDETQTNENWQVTVVSTGIFTQTVYGVETKYLRVDFRVRNKGSDAEYFSPSGIAIIDNKGTQYETAYGGTLKTFKQMYPGVSQEGYLLFGDVPANITSAKLIFGLGYKSGYEKIIWEYQLPLKK